MTPITTSLYNTHQNLNAKLVDFSGYLLPVWYTSQRDEHIAVRQTAGMFDVSHMGAIRLWGTDVERVLTQVTCSSLKKARKSIMTYSMVLNDSAGIMDDVMFGKVTESEWLLIANASNKDRIMNHFKAHLSAGTYAEFVPTYAMIAVQGPTAIDSVERLFSGVTGMPRFGVRTIQCDHGTGYALRTGYTGEDGIELIVPGDDATFLFDQLLNHGVSPCGLAARDSLRIEAGLPLYGHELSESITPLDTRYPWVIDWSGHFIGKAALDTIKSNQSYQYTIGIQLDTKQIARQGSTVVGGGDITSGTLPPAAEKSVAMAIVPKPYEIGTPIQVTIRNNCINGRVVAMPFGN